MPTSRRPPRRSSSATLDVLSLTAIQRGRRAGDAAGELFSDLESVWSRLVASHRGRLMGAIVAACVGPMDFARWQRVARYRYALAPLSCVGSVRTLAGGRFNYGSFDPLNFSPFPALYLAEDRATAEAEAFGGKPDHVQPLSRNELALIDETSIVRVAVSGTLDRVIDLRSSGRLQPLLRIISKFEVPAALRRRARTLKLPEPSFWRNEQEMIDSLLHPDWRLFPMSFALPSPPQSFGHLVYEAGVTGVLFPSHRPKAKRCLAIFPRNVGMGSSVVKLADAAPAAATHTLLDATTYREFVDDV